MIIFHDCNINNKLFSILPKELTVIAIPFRDKLVTKKISWSKEYPAKERVK